MAFDAKAVRAELAALEARLREAEATGEQEDDVLDLACEANELRDLLRNHETYPAFWVPPSAGAAALPAAAAEVVRGECRCIRQLLSLADCEALVTAVSAQQEFSAGCASLLSDDLELARFLWDRTAALLPPELSTSAASREAILREEFWPELPWRARAKPEGLDQRVCYERAGGGEAEPRVDSLEGDDRGEDGRPLLNLIVALQPAMLAFAPPSIASSSASGSAGSAAGGSAGATPCAEELLELHLEPGEAALFPRGDARYAYSIQPAGTIVLRVPVLYVLITSALSAASEPTASSSAPP